MEQFSGEREIHGWISPAFCAEAGRRSQKGEAAELRLDMERLMKLLTEEERELCELLKTRTMSDASRKLKIPRTTLYDRLRRVRKVFEKAGMEAYLR